MNFVGGFMNNIPQFLMPGLSGGMGVNLNINISSLLSSGASSGNQGISDQWVGNNSFFSSMNSPSLMGFGGGMGMIPGFGGSCNQTSSMFGGMMQGLQQQQQMMLMMMMMMMMQQQMNSQQFGLSGFAGPNYSMPQFNTSSIPMQSSYQNSNMGLPQFSQNNPISYMPTSPSSAGQAGVDLARQFKGDLSYTLKGRLPNFQAAGGVNNNCADFVSSILQNTGQLQGHYVGVSKLEQALLKQGYRQVPKEQAQPGDVWIGADNRHTEIVATHGGTKLIGSNNGGKNYQTITEVNTSRTQAAGKFYHKG